MRPIALAVSVAICFVWEFDAVSMIVLAERTNWFGYLVTGGVIAGGSKAAIKLFHDVLDFKSNALREMEADSPTSKKKTTKKKTT